MESLRQIFSFFAQCALVYQTTFDSIHIRTHISGRLINCLRNHSLLVNFRCFHSSCLRIIILVILFQERPLAHILDWAALHWVSPYLKLSNITKLIPIFSS